MNIDKEHIDAIKSSFINMSKKSGLLISVNRAQKVLYENSIKPIPLKSLTYYANNTLGGQRYTQFSIKKKSGGKRTITTPIRGLKLIQSCLNLLFAVVYKPAPYVTGFTTNKSVCDNAQVHSNQNYIFNVDIKDFFPSIKFRKVKNALERAPFFMEDEIAFLVANITCYKGGLPQGAPTSPILSNIVCQRLDRRLNGLAKRFGCNYTRYADDITFSSMHNVYQKYGDFREELDRIVSVDNFKLNSSKTRLQKHTYRQEVTGLIVNRKVNVTRRYMKAVRAMLHNWEEKGLNEAYTIFAKHYLNDRGNVKKMHPDFINVLAGKLEYMRMVRGSKDALVQKYTEQYIRLMLYQKYQLPHIIDISKVLEIWEKANIDQAMAYFYKTELPNNSPCGTDCEENHFKH
jgi:RNA-directed DNA polymerase